MNASQSFSIESIAAAVAAGDTAALIGPAVAACFIVFLVVALWRWASARREARSLAEQLQEKDIEHRTLLETNQALLQDNHEKDLHLSGQGAELENQRLRIREREQLVERYREDEQALRDELERVRGQLARTEADLRGQTVALQEREERHDAEMQVLNNAQEALKKEFENLANKIFEDKGKSFTTTSQASLEALLKPFREQISGFQQRVNEVHDKSVQGNAALEAELKKVLEVGLEMNSQASNLTSALKGDKKTTGNWGEAQLERTLELAGLQPGEHYDSQAAFKDEAGKRKLPDFVIRLPDDKNLVIDSKVSLVDYDRAIAAETEEERTEALAAHAQAVRNHIDDLAKKDYANLPGIGSPNFVLMFMPIEPAYIEAIKQNRDLFNYGYNNNVVMVSHTTLMPILRTVANLWMVDKSNREARDISDRAGDLYNQVARVVERFGKLGNSLRAVQGHYNDTLVSLVGQQGLRGKTEKFKEVSAKANKLIPDLEPIPDELDLERLEVIAIEDKDQQALEDKSGTSTDSVSSSTTLGRSVRSISSTWRSGIASRKTSAAWRSAPVTMPR
ncbi:MAG: DNA recombination protein RmuC [Halioglobus sp.]